PDVADLATASGLIDPGDVQQTTQYFDGLGRLIQTVDKKASPAQRDIVSTTTYDQYGREATRYLPYVSNLNDGFYKVTAQADQTIFNANQFPGESNFYSQVSFEPSPLNRPSENFAPGSTWVGSNKGVLTGYLVNAANDSVQIWKIGATPGSLPTNSGTYPAAVLYKTTTTDEQQHTVVEYKDIEGHAVLKKVQLWTVPAAGHSGWLCTYYVYDDLDNLRFVMSPKSVEWLSGD